MGAGEIGYILGAFATAILLPALVLIVCNFIPAAKRHPKVIYGICAVLAVIPPTLAMRVSGTYGDSAIGIVLALGVLYWGYSRDAKKAAAMKAKQESTAQ